MAGKARRPEALDGDVLRDNARQDNARPDEVRHLAAREPLRPERYPVLASHGKHRPAFYNRSRLGRAARSRPHKVESFRRCTRSAVAT
jgi:hypothetical protein